MSWLLKLMAVPLVLGLCSIPALCQDLDEDWDDEAVADAIKRAVEYLWSKQSGGRWRGDASLARHGNEAGPTALAAYALLAAGVDPQDARMKPSLEYLARTKADGTYTRALRANVWAMLGRESKYRPNLRDDVEYLVRGADRRGGYTYIPAGRGRTGSAARRRRTRYDNSNSQFAVLGVWAGQECGLEVPLPYWQLIHNHWKQDQQDDGGWCYQNKGTSYGSMSVAGLATMFICFDALYYKQFVRCRAETDYAPITRGLKWLDGRFAADANPGKGGGHYYYYLYGVERVGLASGYKYFGRKDWYKLGTIALLQRQRGEGGWGNVVNTSFALLFLARGRHPVLFNKLRYPGTWNSRPRDLANLTRWVSRQFERTVNWQIVHLGAPVRELHDAPILYISGAAAPRFSDDDVARLREFVLQGGVILSEAACSKAGFTLAMREVYARMFPAYELKRLAPDHPIYNLHYDVTVRRRGLWAISNGVRLLAIHSPSELSLAWQMRQYKSGADVFKLGANIYFYVTDKGILPSRGVVRWPRARQFNAVKTLKIAPVKYAGNCDPEPLAWKRFAILMGNRHAVKVEVAAPVGMARLDASAWPVAAMTGTTSFSLSESEKTGLRKYLTDGGTLIVDAAGGSAAFVESAQTQFGEVLPEATFRRLASGHAVFTKVGPRIEKVVYRKVLRAAIRQKTRPRLRAFHLQRRPAIIFSAEDLTAGLVGYPQWGLKGYEPESAFEVMRNILLYASGKKIAERKTAIPTVDDWQW